MSVINDSSNMNSFILKSKSSSLHPGRTGQEEWAANNQRKQQRMPVERQLTTAECGEKENEKRQQNAKQNKNRKKELLEEILRKPQTF